MESEATSPKSRHDASHPHPRSSHPLPPSTTTYAIYLLRNGRQRKASRTTNHTKPGGFLFMIVHTHTHLSHKRHVPQAASKYATARKKAFRQGSQNNTKDRTAGKSSCRKHNHSCREQANPTWKKRKNALRQRRAKHQLPCPLYHPPRAHASFLRCFPKPPKKAKKTHRPRPQGKKRSKNKNDDVLD